MTKKEFAKLKIGDKVRIKKTKSNCPVYWRSPDMDEYIGKVVTIENKIDDDSFRTRETCWTFHYTAIDSVVVGAVDEKCTDFGILHMDVSLNIIV